MKELVKYVLAMNFLTWPLTLAIIFWSVQWMLFGLLWMFILITSINVREEKKKRNKL